MASKEYIEFLEDLIATHRDDQPYFFGVAAGGGVALADLLKLPGASKVVKGIYLPYAVIETSEFIRTYLGQDQADVFSKKAVTQASAEAMAGAAYTRDLVRGHSGNVVYASVTAATTTGRFRKGANEAYICIIPSNFVVHLKLTKLDEFIFRDPVAAWSKLTIREKRAQEDELIAKVTLLLAYDPENDFLKELKANGTLTIVSRY